ncbi:unnamed protein product [Pylaiella littoralis]
MEELSIELSNRPHLTHLKRSPAKGTAGYFAVTMGGSTQSKREKVRSSKGLFTVIYVGAVLVMAVTFPYSAKSTFLLDWSEWAGQPAVPLSERRQFTDATSSTALDPRCLRRLVRECSLQLEVPGRRCGDAMVERDDFRVPFFYSRPSCGFEAPVTMDAIHHLASKYIFRFIGDSTTRRLAESFVSIATGERRDRHHELVEERVDFSKGSLKVIFDWAPWCSGPNLGAGDKMAAVMAEETEESEDRRVVIITAFGVGDADAQRKIFEEEHSTYYVEHLPQDVLRAEGIRAAGLAACREATGQTVRVAEGEGSSDSSPPLVFLLQNTIFKPGSFEQTFLDEVRRLQQQNLGSVGIIGGEEGEAQLSSGCQRGEERMTSGGDGGGGIGGRGGVGGDGGVLGGDKSVGGDNSGDDAREGVFIVEDSVSLYGKLRCYQETLGSHVHEPVKLVEAKMLWDLFALVDLEQSIPAAPPATLQANKADETIDVAAQLSVAGVQEKGMASGASADAVWSKMLEAMSSRDNCRSPPCGKGKHLLERWSDLGEEMSHVQGAVVVRRPELSALPGVLAPAISLDFVKTLESYFAIFKSSLFPHRMMAKYQRFSQVDRIRRFVDDVANGSTTAARYLSPYYSTVVVPKLARDGYENIPTVVGMADVFINERGFLWNAEARKRERQRDYIMPKSCKSHEFSPSASMDLPMDAPTYEKVFVIAQNWGHSYFHFLIEDLPRITLMLDVLRENLDIGIAVSGPSPNQKERKKYMEQLLELLGIDKSRVIFIEKEIHADLAILPTSTPCGTPNTQLVNMLRHTLLQAIYPSTGGIPPAAARPVIVLVVRLSKRWLKNNSQVRNALEQEFPSYDVVEFSGTGNIRTQLQTFATASIIVSPHGAGLSNIIVSPLHTPVLEIGPVECPPCYIHLALKLQHIYARHPASSERIPCARGYEPNVDEIVLLVRDLLEAKRLADAALT